MQNCKRRNEKAREKWLIKGRRENEKQEYHHKRKEAHKIMRNGKKLYEGESNENLKIFKVFI